MSNEGVSHSFLRCRVEQLRRHRCHPPAITYISAAATVVSYATTGKGTSDHLISAIVEQDCALHRVLFEAEICFEKHQTIALAHAPVRQTE